MSQPVRKVAVNRNFDFQSVDIPQNFCKKMLVNDLYLSYVLVGLVMVVHKKKGSAQVLLALTLDLGTWESALTISGFHKVYSKTPITITPKRQICIETQNEAILLIISSVTCTLLPLALFYKIDLLLCCYFDIALQNRR